MTKDNSKHILMQGGTFTLPEGSAKRERPRLHFVPMSLNSQKANACLCFSSLDYDNQVDLHIINYPEDNQMLDFARLNPNMTIPVLEINDVILTDSRDIQKYLTQHHPGKGDAALSQEQKVEMESFIDTVCTWDEYLFSYRQMPKAFGGGMHNIRLVVQADAVNQAKKDGILDTEVLMDGQTIRQAYVKKIAQTRALILVGVDDETAELQKRMEENSKKLDDIFKAANDLLGKEENSGPFLFGQHLSSADAYLLSVVARVSGLSAMDDWSQKYPAVTLTWWEAMQKTDECIQAVTKYDKKWMLSYMLLSTKPFKILGHQLGLYKPAKLPDDIEADVQEELKRLFDAYLE